MRKLEDTVVCVYRFVPGLIRPSPTRLHLDIADQLGELGLWLFKDV